MSVIRNGIGHIKRVSPARRNARRMHLQNAVRTGTGAGTRQERSLLWRLLKRENLVSRSYQRLVKKHVVADQKTRRQKRAATFGGEKAS